MDNLTQRKTMKPFVKWAGGKRNLLEQIKECFPKKFKRYIEPFVGGGAILFSTEFSNSIINDVNYELMTSYKVIRENPTELMDLLDIHKENHNKEYFYNVRSVNISNLNEVENAARFIYLNKTVYNGLYRVNKLGQFNVPIGSYKNPVLYDKENILSISKFLNSIEIYNLDYEKFIDRYVKKGDLVYLDPPYHPISEYSDFKRYSKEQFREADQIKLAEVFDDILLKGAFPILSNSDCEFIRDLYSKHNIKVVQANRYINCKGSGRKNITELIITPKNYEL